MSNRSLRKNNRGVSALEYALIAAVIAGVGAAGASFMGVETDRLLDRVAVVVSGGGEEELEPDTPSTFSGSIVPTTFQWSTNVSTSEMLTVSGGTGPYTLAVISGALPDGLTLSDSIISGTPTTAGSYSFTIQATDSLGAISNTVYSGDVTSLNEIIIRSVGSGTYTVPEGVTQIIVDVIGGGGSGSWGTGTFYNGGSGGGHSRHLFNVSQGMQATYTVGAGGSPPNEGAIGNPGSSSLFSLSGVTLQANGGGGAGQGSGGSASGGSVNCSGGQGGTSVTPNGADAQCGFAGGGGGGCQFGFCGNGGANEIFTGGTGFNTQWSIQNRGWGASGAGGPRGIGLDGNGEDGGQSGNSPPGAGGGAAWGSFTGVFDGEHGMIRILEGVNLDISNYYLD